MAKVFQVPEQLFQATVNYLATRPYNEVNQLMNALFTATKVVEVPDAPTPPDNKGEVPKDASKAGA